MSGESGRGQQPLGPDDPDQLVGEELSETDSPSAGLWRPQTEPAHIDKVRREIARYVVIPLAALYCLVVVAGVFLNLTDERLTSLVASLAGLSSLAAAVIGFYFGQASKGS